MKGTHYPCPSDWAVPLGADQKVSSRLETRLENFPFLTTEYMRWCEHNENPMFVKPCNLTLLPPREEESGPGNEAGILVRKLRVAYVYDDRVRKSL